MPYSCAQYLICSVPWLHRYYLELVFYSPKTLFCMGEEKNVLIEAVECFKRQKQVNYPKAPRLMGFKTQKSSISGPLRSVIFFKINFSLLERASQTCSNLKYHLTYRRNGHIKADKTNSTLLSHSGQIYKLLLVTGLFEFQNNKKETVVWVLFCSNKPEII